MPEPLGPADSRRRVAPASPESVPALGLHPNAAALVGSSMAGSASVGHIPELAVWPTEVGPPDRPGLYSERQPWDPFVGAMLGLACGDALGAPVEFQTRDWIHEHHGVLEHMVGGGQHNWAPGEWTDDTGMALCVAEGILESPLDPVDAIGRRFLQWRTGAKDIGATIAAALSHYRDDWAAASRSTPQARLGQAAGNGSLMRTLPVALAYPEPGDMERQSARISAMTHWDPQAEVGCAVYCHFVGQLLTREPPPQAWSRAVERGRWLASEGPTHAQTPGPRGLPTGFLQRLNDARDVHLEQLQPSGYAGYVLDCLEAAVRMFFEHAELEHALVQTVNLGGEADTMAAVCGGAAGAFHGPGGLRQDWLKALVERDRIETVARSLYALRHRLLYSKPGLPPLTYVRLTDRLMAGRNPLSHKDIEVLRGEGVTEILDLREPHEWGGPDTYGADARAAARWCRLEPWDVPIPDTRPPTPADLDRTWEILHAPRDGTLYVHCRAGRERTAAVLAAWLARAERLTYEQALARLNERGHSRPLPEQERAVREWLGLHPAP